MRKRLPLQQKTCFLIIYFNISVTILVIPVWGRLPDAPPPFSPHYISGFVIFFPVLLTIIFGLRLVVVHRQTHQPHLPVDWLTGGLMLWALGSISWSFMSETRPEIALGAGLQLIAALLFALVIPRIRFWTHTIAALLVCGMLLHGIIGGLQVAKQGSLGLPGEFDIDPQRPGVSVIQAEETRWLRPYGLAAHSNIFAGYIATGVLATAGFILSERRRAAWLGTIAFWFGLWILLLTFSRAAWSGFAIGAVCLLLARLVRRQPVLTRQTIIALAGAMLLAGLFIALYHPLLLVRAGVGENERIEVQSLEHRVVLNDVAITAIERYPLQGVGIGNFPWFASHYLFYETDTGLRGDNVHNIYLGVASELGLIGLVLFLLASGIGIIHGLSRGNVYQMTLTTGLIALAVIGLFDHYPWTQFHYQIMWWGLLATALSHHQYQQTPA